MRGVGQLVLPTWLLQSAASRFRQLLLGIVLCARWGDAADAPPPPSGNCPVGYFQLLTNVTMCRDCPSGYYMNFDSQKFCSECPTGQYVGVPAAKDCIVCGNGQYQIQSKQTSCLSCPGGYYKPMNQDGSNPCIQCPKGHFEPSIRSIQCSTCPNGKFQEAYAKTSCDVCTVGKFRAYQGATTPCSACPRGYFQAIIVGEFCNPCDKGLYASNFQSASCINCGVGTLQVLSGQRSCSFCARGYFQPLTGEQIKCIGCPKGYFALNQRESTCTGCPAGKFQNRNTQYFCYACARGRFTPVKSQKLCTSCAVGHYQPTTAQTSCFLCASGQYQSLAAQTRCSGSACAAGKYGQLGLTKADGTSTICTNDCKWKNDGSCDDGGPNADFDFVCDLGDDCTDCGPRAGQQQSECHQCEQGKYQGSTGQGSCIWCPCGKLSLKGANGAALCKVDNQIGILEIDPPYRPNVDEDNKFKLQVFSYFDVKSRLAPATGVTLPAGTANLPAHFGADKTSSLVLERVSGPSDLVSGDDGLVSTLDDTAQGIFQNLSFSVYGGYKLRTTFSFVMEKQPKGDGDLGCEHKWIATSSKEFTVECASIPTGYMKNPKPGGTGVVACPAGSWCQGGRDPIPCPAGYMCKQGAAFQDPCRQPDFFCPAGTGAELRNSSIRLSESDDGVAFKVKKGYYSEEAKELGLRIGEAKCGSAEYYCENGLKKLVDDGFYTTLSDASALNTSVAVRTAQAVCTVNHFCSNGEMKQCDKGFFCKAQASKQSSVPIGQRCENGQCNECQSGSYSDKYGERCIDCPQVGVDCKTGVLTLLADFWHDQSLISQLTPIDNTTNFYKCPTLGVCTVNSTLGTAGYGAMECALGYDGTLCNICALKFVRFGASCVPCQDGTAAQGLMGMGVIGTLIFFAYECVKSTLKKSRDHTSFSSMASIKIMINYLMMTSLLASFDLDWGSSLRALFEVAAAVSGGVSHQVMSCAFDWTVYQTYLLYFAVPFVILLAPALVIAGRLLWDEFRGRDNRFCVVKSMPKAQYDAKMNFRQTTKQYSTVRRATVKLSVAIQKNNGSKKSSGKRMRADTANMCHVGCNKFSMQCRCTPEQRNHKTYLFGDVSRQKNDTSDNVTTEKKQTSWGLGSVSSRVLGKQAGDRAETPKNVKKFKGKEKLTVAKVGYTPSRIYRTSILVLMYMVWPMVARKTFEMFSYTEVNGVQYISTDFRGKTSDPEFEFYKALALFTGVIVVPGFPLGIYWLLEKNKHQLNDTAVRERYLFIYGGYELKRWYWEVAVLFRKLLLILVAVYAKQNAGYQIYFGLWVLEGALAANIFFKPFFRNWEQTMETASLLAVTVSLLLGQAIALGEPTKQDPTGIDQWKVELIRTIVGLINVVMMTVMISRFAWDNLHYRLINPDWVESQNSAMDTYYWHKKTGVTRWTSPSVYDSDSPVGKLLEAMFGKHLWDEALDDSTEHGTPYFFSRVNEEDIRWEPPAFFERYERLQKLVGDRMWDKEEYEGEEGTDSSQSGEAGAVGTGGAKTVWRHRHTGKERKTQPMFIDMYARPEGAKKAVCKVFAWLPCVKIEKVHLTHGADVWEKHEDAEGNAYYYNTHTHETSWEEPADFGISTVADSDGTTNGRGACATLLATITCGCLGKSGSQSSRKRTGSLFARPNTKLSASNPMLQGNPLHASSPTSAAGKARPSSSGQMVGLFGGVGQENAPENGSASEEEQTQKKSASAEMLGAYKGEGPLKRATSFRGRNKNESAANSSFQSMDALKKVTQVGLQGAARQARSAGGKMIRRAKPKPKPKAKAPPPLSWQIFKTPEGIPYYYHPATGETVWEKPAEEVDEEKEKETTPEKKARESSGGAGLFSGKKLTRNISEKMMRMKKSSHRLLGKEKSSVKLSPVPDESSMPAESTFVDAFVDEASHSKSFYEVNGGEAALLAAADAKAGAAATVKTSNAGATAATSAATNVSVSAWQEHQDAEGNKYYYNTETKETSWEAPVELSKVAAKSSVASTDDSWRSRTGTVKGDIWKVVTPEGGRQYYWNEETGETRYDKP